MLWALMSYDVVDRLVAERAWTVSRLGDHLAVLMVRTFVAPEGSGHQPSGTGL